MLHQSAGVAVPGREDLCSAVKEVETCPPRLATS